MRDHAFGFIDYQQMLVFKDYLQWNIFRNQRGDFEFRSQYQCDCVTGFYEIFFSCGFAVNGEAALLDPFLDTVSGNIRGACANE